jgi:hypothetical protein
MNTKPIIAMLFCCLILASSCIKDLAKIKEVKLEEDLDSDWVIPLVKSKLELKSLLLDSLANFYIDGNGLYNVFYKAPPYSVSAKSLMSIPNINLASISFGLSNQLNMTSWSGSVTDSFSAICNYNDGTGAQLQHIQLKAALLSGSIYVDFQHNFSGTVSFPSITKAGQPLVLPVTINHPNSNFVINQSLADYTIDLTTVAPGYNRVPYIINYTLNGTGNAISGNNSIIANLEIKNISFGFADGFIGFRTFSVALDTVNIGIFKDISNAGIEFVNPTLLFDTRSSIGASAKAYFNNFSAHLKDGTALPLTGSFFGNPLAFPGPTTIGANAFNAYAADKNNSNIQSVISAGPSKFVGKISAVINPSGTMPSYNFIADTSSVHIQTTLILPAWMRIDSSTVSKSFSLPDLPQDTSVIETLEIKVKVENAIPVTNKLQVYFENASGNTIDSLFVGYPEIFPEANVNSNGEIIAPATKYVIVKLTRQQYINIASNAVNATIKSSFKTSGNGAVKIRDVDYINVNMAARALLKLSVKLTP